MEERKRFIFISSNKKKKYVVRVREPPVNLFETALFPLYYQKAFVSCLRLWNYNSCSIYSLILLVLVLSIRHIRLHNDTRYLKSGSIIFTYVLANAYLINTVTVPLSE